MKIIVIGSNGQLGSDVVTAFSGEGHEVRGVTHADMELTSADSVRSCLLQESVDVVVNTAAMHHVEKCEEDPAKAFAVNALGARNLALVTHEACATLIHISTDYVFDGSKHEPYVESDAPLPVNVYGNSKLAGEHFVRSLNPRHFVLRTSAIYGKQPCRAKGGLNFVELMLKLARERGRVRVVDSEFVSPTSTLDLARQIVRLSSCEAYGLYHATAEESCSWYEFAREIFLLADVKVNLEVASPSEFPAKVPRPQYSMLENGELKKRGLNVFRPWQEGLRQYLGMSKSPAASCSQERTVLQA
jgi:dTDP-4-dehydrorhamnose reductase